MTSSPILTSFTVAAVELPGLDLSVDDIEGGDSVQATGKQGVLVVNAEGLNLMPEEDGQQVLDSSGVSVLGGVPVGQGGTEELRPDVLVQQTAREGDDWRHSICADAPQSTCKCCMLC